MNLDQEFEKKAFEERLFLKKLLPLIYSDQQLEPLFQFTPSHGKDVYDCCVCLYDFLTKCLVHRHIIEIKVRDKFYPTLLLEKKKLESLKKIAAIAGSIVYYISVTPNGTFLFNLTDLEPELVFNVEDHWASTTNKSLGKIPKSVTHIPIEKGIKLNVFTSDLEKLRQEESKTNQIEKLVESHRRTKVLYQGILFKGFEL
jgi:hypothetical protein